MRATIQLLPFFIIFHSSLVYSLPLSLPQGKLVLPQGETLITYLAISLQEKSRGLSGIKDKQMKVNEALFFYYPQRGERLFWMVDTYIDLDIFFLDKNLKVIKIYRKMKAHPGRNVPPFIQSTANEISTHVLELRSDSKLSQKIKRGDVLRWSPAFPLSQKELNTRLRQ